MDKWLMESLEKIHALAGSGEVAFTYKALREIEALGLGLDETDVVQILVDLKPADFKERIESNITHEWLYIFLISIESHLVYLKLALRDNCLVISFHEDRPYE